jgi:hypothetical protein
MPGSATAFKSFSGKGEGKGWRMTQCSLSLAMGEVKTAGNQIVVQARVYCELNNLARPLPAIFADTVDLKIVPCGVKTIFASDLFLNLRDFGREELHGSAAFAANHVVMAATVELVFEARSAVGKWNHAGQSAFRQQLQGAIDGGESDFGVLLANKTKKLVGRKMVASFQKCAQNCIPLFGVLQPNPLQVTIEDLLGFAHSFPRGWCMIVNPSLQHLSVAKKAELVALVIEIEIQFQL